MCSTRGGSEGMYTTFASTMQIKQNPLWLCNPEEMSPEIQNRGTHGPKIGHCECVRQKNFSKKRKKRKNETSSHSNLSKSYYFLVTRSEVSGKSVVYLTTINWLAPDQNQWQNASMLITKSSKWCYINMRSNQSQRYNVAMWRTFIYFTWTPSLCRNEISIVVI